MKRARILRMPTARRPWLVTVRLDGQRPHIPRSFYTHAEALAHALHEVGLTPTNPKEKA